METITLYSAKIKTRPIGQFLRVQGNGFMDNVVIVAAKRTAIGSFCGSLADLPAHLLGARIIESLIKETAIPPADVSEVVMGQVVAGGCGQNPARQAAVHAGLPFEVPAYTLNKVCGSGLFSVMLAAQSITCGNNSIVIAGGQENMSISKHSLLLRKPYKTGDVNLSDEMIVDGLTDAFNNYHMGITAENVAEKYSITRKDQDEFSLASQRKAEHAQKKGAFVDEIVPISIINKKEEKIFNQDEFPRHGTTMELLSRLRPAFKTDGTVTAGNASGINDGAAAVMVMTRTEANKRKLPVIAEVVSMASSGVDPKIMGIAPVYAVRKALKLAKWDITSVDLFELNEAFAAQSVAVNRELAIDTKKVNVNGGAIALGHPIGASGARCLVTLLYQMMESKAKKGVVSLCIGGGMGVAMCLQREN